MEIGGLPGIGYTGTAVARGGRREPVVVEVRENPQPRRVAREQVVQGEVLERRRRGGAAGTADFLRGRLFEGTAEAGGGTRDGRGRRAAGAYLAHTREAILPDANRGTRIDAFV